MSIYNRRLEGQPIKLIQNCMKINETTFFSLKLFPVIAAAGPQKFQKTVKKLVMKSLDQKL